MKRNPSRWAKRLTVVALALIGFIIALYLAFYQFGIFSTVWEPFFGSGSKVVLHSPLSQLLPIPDASFGALGYFFEIILGLAGDSDRWQSQPWIVVFYGLVGVSLGAISILLIIYQAFFLNAWCTLCLASAALSIVIAMVALDEVAASLRCLKPA